MSVVGCGRVVEPLSLMDLLWPWVGSENERDPF